MTERAPRDDASTLTYAKPVGEKQCGWRLYVTCGRELQIHDLPWQGRIIVGRDEAADVTIRHRAVSRRHAALHLSVDTVTVTDFGSHNGTVVGDRSLSKGETAFVDPTQALRLGCAALLLEPIGRGQPDDAAKEEEPIPDEADLVIGRWLRGEWPLLRRVAAGEIPVLLLGETGVGKEVIARLIHRASSRASRRVVNVNCAALPAQLAESELFGYARGAFTGAGAAKAGLIEEAQGGTLVLDEVGELPLELQVKLLRVLETGDFRRIGELCERKADVRLISATNRDLSLAVERGEFRADLLFRINALTLEVPPLRERPDEVIALARRFLEDFALLTQGSPVSLAPETTERLERYRWPGNVRELKNAIERAALVAGAGAIYPEHLPPEIAGMPAHPEVSTVRREACGSPWDPVEQLERERVIAALAASAGNQTRAAEALGISRRTLVNRLDKYRIPRPRKDWGGR